MKDENISKNELIDELKKLHDNNKKLEIELSKTEAGLWIDEIWYGYIQSPIPTLILSKDGEERHVEFSVFDPLHREKPTNLQIVKGDDITERKQAEELPCLFTKDNTRSRNGC